MSIYLSVLLSFNVFFLSYDTSQLIYHLFEASNSLSISEINEEYMQRIRIILSIISFCAHMLISITFLAYTKDLIFSFFMIYFLIGYFTSDIFLLGKESDNEKIAGIVLISLNVFSFVYTLFIVKKEDFGIIRSEDVDELISIRISHKTSCSS